MKKIIVSGLVAGVVLLLLSVTGLFCTMRFFPQLANEYFDPAFDSQSGKFMIYLIHPFIISMALAWFWQRFKGTLTGSYLKRGIEFGLIYAVVATFPMMWMIYSAINVSLEMVATWMVFGICQGIVAGLVFEKMNP
ncbi:MAG: hypothetical protein ABIQ40_12420 [Bacteroidia bacterium]